MSLSQAEILLCLCLSLGHHVIILKWLYRPGPGERADRPGCIAAPNLESGMLRSFSLVGFAFLALAAFLKAAPRHQTPALRVLDREPPKPVSRPPVVLMERALPFHARFSLN